ncbi:carboxymuconolactone decarboxylase family protein [Azospirillum brasilense]|uniref:Carboxymuconolactone decarboxylase family protein n=1 Tax=Azospirillum brasilense TaxID=192 RepID=A0A6L3AV19_AZOBR|nr:carboxymuconolactone decarboxylase family protein [Azospirillum brasilense]KAA0680549.1 carboxymuconolactone decarboxylase family protein [Azospirillum brasilense]
MARIIPVDRSNPPAAVAPQLAAIKAKIGKVPNVLATLAQSPAALGSYLAVTGALAGGALSAKDRERIALAVAQANGCDYCLSAHSLSGKAVGLSETEVLAARAGQPEDPRSNAIVTLTRSILDNRGRVPTVVLEAVRTAGLDDAIILEVLANTVGSILTNYANNLIETDLDFPKAPALPA